MEKPTSLLIKLGSLAIHVEEMFGSNGHQFDVEVIKTLLNDAEIRDFLDNPEMAVFLPIKRR